jgi:hypothetical protein
LRGSDNNHGLKRQTSQAPLDEIATTGGTAIANHADLSKSEEREQIFD